MKVKILCALAWLLLTAWAWEPQENAEQVGFITNIGNPMPHFTVDMVDGNKLDTRTLKGKVILLNFWGAKCGGCLLEMKRFPDEILKPFGKSSDFILLPIEAQKNTKEEIKSVAQRLKFNFPLAYENGQDIGGLFYKRVFGLPRTLIIDRDGKIVYQAFGYTTEGFNQMLKVLDKTINEK